MGDDAVEYRGAAVPHAGANGLQHWTGRPSATKDDGALAAQAI
jgi:hypothetical protein